jgi:hypothetical protein
MLSRGPDVDIEPYYCLPVGALQNHPPIPWSQPTSPTPPSRNFGGLLSPTHSTTGVHRLVYPKKNDEGEFNSRGSKLLHIPLSFFLSIPVHGSQASLVSGGSSLYGSTEERQASEVRRLKRELMDARDQVCSLSGQLSANVSTNFIQFEHKILQLSQEMLQPIQVEWREKSN